MGLDTDICPKYHQSIILPYSRRMVTSWPILILWVFLSLSLALLSTFSFLQADWVVKRDLVVTRVFRPASIVNRTGEVPPDIEISNSDFTPYLNPRYSGIDFENETISVNRQTLTEVTQVTQVVTTVRFGLIGLCTTTGTREMIQCFLYEHWNQNYSISVTWPFLTLVGGSGCVTLCVCSVLSLLALALPTSLTRHQVATTIGHAQTVGVILLITALLGFPLGFTSEFVLHHCGPLANVYSPGDCEIGWAYALVLVSTSLSLYCPVLVKFTVEIRYKVVPRYI